MSETLWYKNAVFYELYVRAFCDSDADGQGDLRGLASRLDYLQSLGVDCVWLLPIYPSPLRDDGYDIADFYNIHPDFGTLEDFKYFLDRAHELGLRVILDLVLNHTSDQHPWFQAARADRNSPYRDYYVWSDTPDRYADARIIFLDIETSNWTWDEQAGQYFWHRFFSSQPDLNYENPAVQEEMLKVVKFWLDMGVDGFRADAVPYLFEEEGTNCENLPKTHVFLKRLRRHIDEHYPGRVLLCEANQWPEDVRSYFGDGDEFQMGFHFPVMPRIFMALATADRTPVVEILQATPEIPDSCQWCTFLRNHDELTLEMVTPEERTFMWNTYAPEPRMRLNLGIRRRLAPLLDGERRKIELLNSILFTLPGSPIIYYGDEMGMGDDIWLPDRDGVRMPMQWDDSPNAGFSNAPADQLYHAPVEGVVFDYRTLNVAAQKADQGSLWHTIRKMVAMRKTTTAFGCGELEFLAPENKSILAFTRGCQQEVMLVVHNLSSTRQEVALDLLGWQGAAVKDILSAKDYPPVGPGPYSLNLEPYGYLWLRLQNA
ncbi:MAG TPA: maltose alpha-D-glucosyltransferase [Anaerolineales bacterium]|nr:maltose alpha-D-glucosyltransferase [Anaerolineales bacterium]